ncbi:MAG: FadR family transcriptional regulator [Spirochaetaceae bacterium]|nr:MAG: FadR family transcriptional regulator [Spirochaetaceae bacterium]
MPAEHELTQSLGVSRFSLREALRVAQAQGLIEISQGRRPRVAAPTADAAAGLIELTLRRSRRTLLDLAEGRIVLETHIARQAALKATEQSMAAMQATVDAVKAHPGDPDRCVDADIEFHRLLVEAAGNLVFEIMLAPLARSLRDARRETIRRGVRPVLDGHSAVLRAVRARDGDAAERAMREHLELARSHLTGAAETMSS